jgi:hypothetical protein
VHSQERRHLVDGARRRLVGATAHWLLYVRGTDLYAARIDA